MTGRSIEQVAVALVGGGRGLLAIDESIPTCNRRFATAGIPQTEAARRAWRELLVTTPGLAMSVSGVILCDETFRQSTLDGQRFVDILTAVAMVPGIKVDIGPRELAGQPGETVTEGLDGLRGRLREYAALGAGFAKWRAVLTIGDGRPSRGCIDANTHALARYAALCQEAGLVPVVEADILTDGAHGLDRSRAVTEEVLERLFEALGRQRVVFESMVLKPSMVTPGAACLDLVSVNDVAEATLACLSRCVPAAVPGIALLSGGQSGELASARLNAMNLRRRETSRLPWALTFSFGRAMQHPALEVWGGRAANVAAAQAALLHRASCNRAALQGEYDAEADVVKMRSPAAALGTESVSDLPQRDRLIAIRPMRGAKRHAAGATPG